MRAITDLPDHVPHLWLKVPAHLRDGLERYLVKGVLPDGFLRAVLSNNLVDAVLRADPVSLASLVDLVRYLRSCAPATAFGSEALMVAYAKAQHASYASDKVH